MACERPRPAPAPVTMATRSSKRMVMGEVPSGRMMVAGVSYWPVTLKRSAMSYLRSGIFLAPFHNLTENPTLALERDMELLQHLDTLNYHEAWIGEHHSGGFEIIASPEMFIAAAAERTRHIRLGTGVASLPYHNPFILADRMVQLDHMTRGRAMFGVGPGALVHDALKIGIDPSDQRQMMEESFDVIVRLMNGETVSKKTDWFNITDAQLQLRPYTRPTTERAVPAARSAS